MTNTVEQGALNASSERSSGGFSGYLALSLMLGALALGAWLLTRIIGPNDAPAVGDVAALIVAGLAFILLSAGFYMIEPNQGVAITLFGAYKGTDRNEGLRWACSRQRALSIWMMNAKRRWYRT